MRIVNLTPHAVNVIVGDSTITYEPSGVIARVSSSTETLGSVTDEAGNVIPLTRNTYGEIEGLPETRDDDTLYIVSAMVAQAAAGREDLCIPNEAVRDSEGRIIGCKSLGRI